MSTIIGSGVNYTPIDPDTVQQLIKQAALKAVTGNNGDTSNLIAQAPPVAIKTLPPVPTTTDVPVNLPKGSPQVTLEPSTKQPLDILKTTQDLLTAVNNNKNDGNKQLLSLEQVMPKNNLLDLIKSGGVSANNGNIDIKDIKGLVSKSTTSNSVPDNATPKAQTNEQIQQTAKGQQPAKDNFDDTIKQKMLDTLNPPTKPMNATDYVNQGVKDFQNKDWMGIVRDMANVMGTSAGTNLMGGIASLFDKHHYIAPKDNAFVQDAATKAAEEAAANKNYNDANEKYQTNLKDILNNEGTNSSKSFGFADMTNIMHDTKMIDDQEFARRQLTDEYKNNITVPTSSLDLAYSGARQNNSFNNQKTLEGLKQNDKISFENLEKFPHEQQLEFLKSKLAGQNQVAVKTTPGAKPIQSPEDKELQDLKIQYQKEQNDALKKKNSGQDQKTQQGQKSLERYSANLDQLQQLMKKTPNPSNIFEQAGANAPRLFQPNFNTPERAAFEAQKKHVAMTGMKAIEDITGRPATYTMEQLMRTLPDWDDSASVKAAKMQTFQDQVKTSAGINFNDKQYKSPYGKTNPQGQGGNSVNRRAF